MLIRMGLYNIVYSQTSMENTSLADLGAVIF